MLRLHRRLLASTARRARRARGEAPRSQLPPALTGVGATIASMQGLQLASSSVSVGAAASASSGQEAPGEEPLARWLRTCMECNENIEGSIFMLHDQPYSRTAASATASPPTTRWSGEEKTRA